MAQRGIKTIIMDRGFYSEANVKDLHKLNIDMIVGVKQSIGIKKEILVHIDKERIYSSKRQVILKATVVYVQEVEFLSGKLVVVYNPKYEALKKDKPRSKQVFFKLERTVPNMIVSKPSFFFNSSTSSRIVHLLLPSGAGPHARAINSAS